MNITKRISLTPQTQLVDLNGNLTNFEIYFNVKEENGKSFKLAVVDQTMLDQGVDIKYQDVNGEIDGELNSRKGIYQNYFICLKSETSGIVDITIKGKEVEPNPEPEPKTLKLENISKKGGIINWLKKNWKYLLFVLVIIGALIYFFYDIKVPKTDVQNTQLVSNDITLLPPPPPPKVDIELPPPPKVDIELPPPPKVDIELPPPPKVDLDTNLLGKLKSLSSSK